MKEKDFLALKRKQKKRNYRSVISLIIIIGFFLLMSYIVQNNIGNINQYLSDGLFGMFIYVFIVALSIILAPVAALPILPVATKLWGWVGAGFLAVLGWSIGAFVAFVLARKYGTKLVGKLIPLEDIRRHQKIIPKTNLFLMVTFLRMIMPIDGLSYALGLFTNMSLLSYMLATVIGIIPFSLTYAYLGSLPFLYQVIGLAAFFAVFGLSVLIAFLRKKSK